MSGVPLSGKIFPLSLDNGRSPHVYINQRLQIQFRAPDDERYAFSKVWNNKLYYKVASCWLFLLIHTTMHGFMNIKFNNEAYGYVREEMRTKSNREAWSIWQNPEAYRLIYLSIRLASFAADEVCYLWYRVWILNLTQEIIIKNPNHTSLNENYVVPCICLRAIWHMHGSMRRATRMTRDRKRIIVAHCVIALWRHYCRGSVEGHFSGYPSHKTYTCQY